MLKIDGKEIEVPSLVPTLSKKEIQHLRNRNPKGGLDRSIPIEFSIMKKAKDHAIPFLRKGQTPFYRDKLQQIGI